MASNLIAKASNLITKASNPIVMASNQIAKASNLILMAFTLVAMASNLIAMASNLIATASSLTTKACNLVAMVAHGHAQRTALGTYVCRLQLASLSSWRSWMEERIRKRKVSSIDLRNAERKRDVCDDLRFPVALKHVGGSLANAWLSGRPSHFSRAILDRMARVDQASIREGNSHRREKLRRKEAASSCAEHARDLRIDRQKEIAWISTTKIWLLWLLIRFSTQTATNQRKRQNDRKLVQTARKKNRKRPQTSAK